MTLLSTSPMLSTCPPRPHIESSYQNTGCVQNSHYPIQNEDASDDRTTLMVRNLPADLSQPDFVQQFIDAGYRGMFDFVYMPMNLRGCGNFGYAFINFRSHAVAAQVMMQMQQHGSEDTSSSDKWSSAWSTCQGLAANAERYRNSPLMHELVPQECKPAVYDHNGDRALFPAPTKTISKPRIHWPRPKDSSYIEAADSQPRQSLDDQQVASSVPECHACRTKKIQRRWPAK